MWNKLAERPGPENITKDCRANTDPRLSFRRDGSTAAAGLLCRRSGLRQNEGIPALARKGEYGMGCGRAAAPGRLNITMQPMLFRWNRGDAARWTRRLCLFSPFANIQLIFIFCDWPGRYFPSCSV